MQRSHTLCFVLTFAVACGSGPTGPKAAPTDPGEAVVAMSTSSSARDADTPTPAPGLPPAGPPAPPRPACEDGTTVQPAAFPDPSWFCVRADGTRHGPFFTLFPDHTIQIEGRYKDGTLDGPWQRHYPGGALAEAGTYVAGLPDGVWTQYGRDGARLGDYTLKAGTGKQKRWYDDGPLYREVQLRKGVPHGSLVVRDRNGAIVITAKLASGKLDGKHVVGSKNMLRIEETFRRGVRQGPRQIWQFWALLIDETYDERGRLDGAFAIWRDKKVPRVQGTYEHGKRVGTWVWTDRQAKKEREGAYAAGKKTGTWSEWIEGKLSFQGAFTSDGKPDGEFVYYDKTGAELGRFTIRGGTGTMLTFHGNKRPATKTRVAGGLMNGTYEELTSRGKVLVEGHYASDRRHGWWREWTESGALVHEIHYKRGKLDGAFKKYEGGKLAVEATYKDGKAEGPYTEYRAGKPSLTGQFAGDRRTGTWTRYDATGTPTLVATYQDGVLDGAWREIRDGSVTQGQLAMGRPIGTWTYTDRAGSPRTIEHKTP